MSKLIFKRNTVSDEVGSVVMRIRTSAFIRVEKISKDCGLPIIEVASRMIEEQAKETEVVD